ncbi:MAG: hypothetical protein QM610_04725 [Chitinophagaceae bacterium]
MIRLYKILTFLLQPIGFVVLMMSMSTLMMAMSAPQLLIAGAVGVCVFLYTFFCFRFTVRAVVANEPVKANLKDWIKVNSYVTLLQGLLMLFSVVALLVVPEEAFGQAFRQTYDMLVAQSPNSDFLTYGLFVKTMRTTFAIVGVVELLLVVHVFLGWRMLKGYREYFSK